MSLHTFVSVFFFIHSAVVNMPCSSKHIIESLWRGVSHNYCIHLSSDLFLCFCLCMCNVKLIFFELPPVPLLSMSALDLQLFNPLKHGFWLEVCEQHHLVDPNMTCMAEQSSSHLIKQTEWIKTRKWKKYFNSQFFKLKMQEKSWGIDIFCGLLKSQIRQTLPGTKPA